MSKDDDIALQYVIEEFREFLQHVIEMRTAQKEYFKTRTKESLLVALSKEKELDEMIHDRKSKLSEN